MLMVEVVLFLGEPTFNAKNIIMSDKVVVGGFRHIIVIAHHPPRSYLVVGIIHLVLLMFLWLVLFLDMVNVVWVLVPLTLPSIKFMVLLIVVFFVAKE